MRAFPQPGAITLLAVVLTTCLLLFLFQKIIWLVVPALLSLMLYYCLRPAVQALVLGGLRHGMAVKSIWLLLQVLAAAMVLAGVVVLLARAGSWQNRLVHYLAGGQNLLSQTAGSLERAFPVFQRMHVGTLVDQRVRQFTGRFAEDQLLPLALLLLKWLPSVLLVPFITYYMLNDAARLKKYLIKSVPNAYFEKSLLLFARLDTSLQNYFQGLLLLTLLDTACLAAGLGLLGIAHAAWLAIAAAVLAWIPYLGSVAGCVMVVLATVTDSPDKGWLAYASLVLFIAVRLLDDFVFLPLTIGRKLHIHPVLSVVMLFLGGTVAGATGLVLALPLFGVVAVIGQAVAEVISDHKLRARFRGGRRLAALSAKREAMKSA